jgi:hypothetical protein
VADADSDTTAEGRSSIVSDPDAVSIVTGNPSSKLVVVVAGAVVATTVVLTAVVVVGDVPTDVVEPVSPPPQAATTSAVARIAVNLERKTSSHREDEGGRSVP